MRVRLLVRPAGNSHGGVPPTEPGVIVIRPAADPSRTFEEWCDITTLKNATITIKGVTYPHMRAADGSPLPFIDTDDDPAESVGKRFRDAWRLVAGRCVEDLPACRAIRMSEIRAERNQRLAASDGPRKLSDDNGLVSAPAWKDYQQTLRDLPALCVTALESRATPEALAGYTPPWPEAPK